jgi:magnesium transporter
VERRHILVVEDEQPTLTLLEKIKYNAAKFAFTPEETECLDDTIIENRQCGRQAEIYSNILASMTDARASIVSNNINVLVKTLNIITIAIMVPTRPQMTLTF